MASNSTLSESQILLIPSTALPIGPQITHLLQEFSNLATSLFTVLSSPSSSTSLPPSTIPIFTALAAVDSKLAAVLEILAEHQRKQKRIDELVAQIQATESSWRESTITLHESILELKPIIQSGLQDRKLISQSLSTDNSQLSPEIILSYARLLAPFTAAPPTSLFGKEIRGLDYTSGRNLPENALPPFPLESAMRRGRLQFGRVGPEDMGILEDVGGRFFDSWIVSFVTDLFRVSWQGR